MDRSIVACLVALVFSCAAPCAAQVSLGFPNQPEREVKLPGAGLQAGARLYAPVGAGPFPAAVLSHSCAGLRQNIFEWAQRFLTADYAVLIVDHLGPRGMKGNCPPTVNVSETEYAQDDVAAMKHLRVLPFVDGKHIVHMGFSYGAAAGLLSASENFRARYLDHERFAAIIGLYPPCRGVFYDDTTTPLLVVVGANDNETDPRSCVNQAKKNAANGMPVESHLLPGTTHGFDHSLLGDNPYSFQQGNRWIIYRYNREAVEATWKLTLDFLRRHLGGAGPR